MVLIVPNVPSVKYGKKYGASIQSDNNWNCWNILDYWNCWNEVVNQEFGFISKTTRSIRGGESRSERISCRSLSSLT